MTTQELLKKVSISWKYYGTFKVTIEFRGNSYSCTSHNTLAFYRIRSDNSMSKYCTELGYTYKQAWQAFYDECKRANNLGEYAY